MKNTFQKNYRNKHISVLTKAEQEVFMVYDSMQMRGKIPSSRIMKKQIDLILNK